MDPDECFSAIGGFGTYQKTVIYLVLLPAVLPCAFHAYNQIFMSGKPEHWCRDNVSEYVNNSIPVGVEDEFDHSYDSMRPDNDKHGWTYDETKYGATVVTEWDLICDKDHYPMMALVLFSVGGLIGNLCFGYVQDSLGRRLAFFIYLLIETLFSIGSVLADDFLIWLLFRFGVGFTIPAILGTPYVLSVELVEPGKRAYCTVLLNVMYSIGLVALSGVAYLLRDWRKFTLATTLPFTVFFFYWWVLPESPRWLLANGEFERAEQILKKIARVNGKRWSPQYMDSLKVSLEENRTLDRRRERYGIADLFRYRRLRLNTLIITFIWFTNTAVYVGLSYYAPNLGGDEYFNFFLSGVVELPTYIFLLRAIEKGGRRWTLCISMIIGGLACLGTIALENVQPALIALYCVAKMGISCSFVVVPLLASELYPTVVRGIGISFSSVIGQIGPIVIPLINYWGKERIILPLVVMGIISVIGGALSLMLPETLNLHLPQTLEDGQVSAQRSSRRTNKEKQPTP